jgi:hypothetical protein
MLNQPVSVGFGITSSGFNCWWMVSRSLGFVIPAG